MKKATQFVWLNEYTAELHVSFMDDWHWLLWAALDPQGLERARDMAEPPMNRGRRQCYCFMGEL